MPAVLLVLGDTQVQAQQNGDLVVVTVPSLQRLGVTLRPAAASPSPSARIPILPSISFSPASVPGAALSLTTADLSPSPLPFPGPGEWPLILPPTPVGIGAPYFKAALAPCHFLARPAFKAAPGGASIPPPFVVRRSFKAAPTTNHQKTKQKKKQGTKKK